MKDITLVQRSIKKTAYQLGIPTVIDPSSLSKANEVRDYRIFEELGMWLICKVCPMYVKQGVPAPLAQNQNVKELELNL